MVTPTLKTRTYDYHMGAVPDPLLENSSTATSFAELLPLSRARRMKLSCEIVLFSLRSNPRKFMNHDLSLTCCCPFPRQENNPGTLCCMLAAVKKVLEQPSYDYNRLDRAPIFEAVDTKILLLERKAPPARKRAPNRNHECQAWAAGFVHSTMRRCNP